MKAQTVLFVAVVITATLLTADCHRGGQHDRRPPGPGAPPSQPPVPPSQPPAPPSQPPFHGSPESHPAWQNSSEDVKSNESGPRHQRP
ncbi:submaxillary gland androgen-regulated protein 3A-like [Protopterus annectens]|uniref:submaxillary gland androgen-regulated protein 3A-like n=1 Tax=Protopterus annectens TaxID=7888 RepID=UPI001CF94B15|nr:submaxillary gland androgen-regulated protein 3A-like [Protopterus annectens]